MLGHGESATSCRLCTWSSMPGGSGLLDWPKKSSCLGALSPAADDGVGRIRAGQAVPNVTVHRGDAAGGGIHRYADANQPRLQAATCRYDGLSR